MVGKTTQVREMIINRLDQTGERTIIDRAANKTDVFEKAQFQQQLGNIQGLTSGNFSNILVSQADITRIDGILSENNINPDSTAFNDLLADHESNVTRIETLETVHLANALIVDNTFANVTVLQSNVIDITANIIELESNSFATHANVAKLQANVVSIENNIDTIESCVSAISASITGIDNFGDVADVAVQVNELTDRVAGTNFVKIGGDRTGEGSLGAQPTIVGINSGRNIGNYSIAIGYQTQNFSQPIDALGNTIFLNASGRGKNPSRSNATYITPIQEDNANVIAIMGSNTATDEIVTTSLLRLKDSDIQSNTNIKVYTDDYTSLKATISNDTGNSSFAGNMQNQGTLTVGGVSSFSGNMSIKDSSLLIKSGGVTKASINKDGTSSFAGVMSVNNAANFDGTVTFKNTDTETAKINGTDGTSSFSGAMQVDNNATVDGTFLVKNDGTTKAQILDDGASSFLGAMQVNNDVTVDGSFLVKNDGTTKAEITDNGIGSFSSGLVSGTYAGYGSMRLFDSSFSIRDAGGSNIKIDLIPDGTSSFLGAMQVDNDVTVDGSFLVKTGGTTKAQILDDGTSSFSGAMQVDNDATVDGSFLVKNGGTTKAQILDDGTASFAGGLTITGSVNIYDDVEVYSESDIKFRVNASEGTGSFAGNLQCDGTATLDNVTTSGIGSFNTLKCNTTATLDNVKTSGTGSFGTLNVTNNGSFGGTLKAEGATTLGGNLNVTNNGSFGGTLKAAGATTLGGTLNVTSNGSFGGTLKAAGATTLGGTLNVTSNGSFGGTLQVLDTLAVGGTSSFGGDLQVQGGLNVSANGSFSGNLQCDGTATLDNVTTSGTGSFTTLKCNNTATLDTVKTSGTGSFGNLKCNGTATLDAVITSGTGSFGTLNCGGNITAAGDVTAFSDRRLKSDIKPIESALEKVKKLCGYTYTKDGKHSTGVIAQEVLEVLPEAVHGSEETMYSVAYGNMVGLLIEAIKELSER
jgi:hypothetical protein